MSQAWRSSHGPSRYWRSGAWSLELRHDEIADIAFDGRSVLRSVRAVVRDRDWNTAAWVSEGARESADALHLALRSDGHGSAISGMLHVTASGDTLSVTFDAVSHTEFATNRTGLVVLHPPQLTGHDLTVTHTAGPEETTRFPVAISPHQPVFDIAGLAWHAGGLAVDVCFSGDVFEMEDQRNWTDASYKTYSRPLALPFPYVLEAGERVVQSVVVTAQSVGTEPAAGPVDRIVLERTGVFPAVTVGASTAPDPAPSVAPVGSSLLVELDLASSNWSAALRRAAASGLPLDVRFVLDDEDHGGIRSGVKALAPHRIARVSAFWPTGPARHVSDVAATRLLREALAIAGIDIPVIGGAGSHFTELNREYHRLPDDLDGVVFSVTPLFHSLTTEQLTESLAMQRLVAAQAVKIAGGAPVHIGPISLRPHFNNVATTPAPVSPSTDLRSGYGPQLIDADDDRQSSPELAAWTIASAAALAVPGVDSLSYFEEWGPRGIRTSEGEELAVAVAVKALSVLSGSLLLSGESPDGLLWAIGGETSEGMTVIIANLDRVSRSFSLQFAGTPPRVDVLAGEWLRIDLPQS
ncbi:hypothetical protein ABZ863_30530 [Saccharomonospora sp. NPDC046836]|uniref:hypothetical protein n=1 Tax=Saccharomonospora sp. NPDC046836 TaxID=3156921 RepID=UPI0033FA739C